MGMTRNNETSKSSIQTVCLVVIATAVTTYLIYWLRPVLVPFVVALFVVSGITPVLESLESRFRVNRLVAAAITFLVGLLVLVVVGFCLWLSVLQMADRGQAYRERVGELLVKITATFDLDADDPEGRRSETGVAPQAAADSATSDPGALGHVSTANSGRQMDEKLRRALDLFLRNGLSTLSAELLSLVTTSLVVLIYVFFMLAGAGKVASDDGSFQKINAQIRQYLLLKTVISIVTGAAFGLALWVAGVPMALTFGVLAFLLNYIPNIGPIVASLLPVPFILLDPQGSLAWMISVIGVASGIQVVSGNVVEPKMMGQSSNLHPVVILLALMLWGMLWGITGMFLATPITAAIKIVLDGIESAKPVSDLLAGQWGDLDRAKRAGRDSNLASNES